MRLRAYRGQTSAGTKIAFVIRIADDGRMSMKELHLQVEMTCDDATTLDYGSVWWFGGVGPRLDGRRLTYDAVYGPEATHITGVFRATTADGTFKTIQAWLTDDEQAQLCSTGDLTWTANKVPLDRVAGRGAIRRADVTRQVRAGSVRTVWSSG